MRIIQCFSNQQSLTSLLRSSFWYPCRCVHICISEMLSNIHLNDFCSGMERILISLCEISKCLVISTKFVTPCHPHVLLIPSLQIRCGVVASTHRSASQPWWKMGDYSEQGLGRGPLTWRWLPQTLPLAAASHYSGTVAAADILALSGLNFAPPLSILSWSMTESFSLSSPKLTFITWFIWWQIQSRY